MRKCEIDFGVHWTHFFFPGVKFRVTWSEETGKLYAISLYPARKIILSLGNYTSREEVEKRMKGWVDAMWKKNSLQLFFPELKEVET